MQKTEINRMFYDSHWRQSWKANFMYDPISKRKIARYVLERAGFEDGKKEILDIGFGFGIILFSFDRSDNIQGVELADSAVELAREKARKRGYHNFEFLKYSGEGRIPLEDNKYDLVICSHVLEHVPDDKFLLSEIKRLMKANGIALLNIPINEEHFDDPRHVRKYSTSGFLKQIHEHGFVVRYSFEGDRLWNLFGWFFEKDYHNRIPILGFLLSSCINVFFSSIPFVIQKRIEEAFFAELKPRQFAVCVTK